MGFGKFKGAGFGLKAFLQAGEAFLILAHFLLTCPAAYDTLTSDN